METFFEVEHADNKLDFKVTVMRFNRAPQTFHNLPIVNCLQRCGCTQEEIINAREITLHEIS